MEQLRAKHAASVLPLQAAGDLAAGLEHRTAGLVPDPNVTAFNVIQVIAGATPPTPAPDGKDPAVVSLGRNGGWPDNVRQLGRVIVHAVVYPTVPHSA